MESRRKNSEGAKVGSLSRLGIKSKLMRLEQSEWE
jgi:hypothetical protein